MVFFSDVFVFFFFNDTATTEIYTLSLHDALPIFGAIAACLGEEKRSGARSLKGSPSAAACSSLPTAVSTSTLRQTRSEEHTSELQSRLHLVCRLLLEKKKKRLHDTFNPIAAYSSP